MRRCGVWLILLLIVFGLSACTHKQVCPEDGVWYCEELQAQFYMNWEDDFADDEFPIADETVTYVIVNGDRIAAGCGYYKWSEVVSIYCLEQNHPVYDFGEDIYSMECVRLTDTEYVLKDLKDEGKYYTFVRIGDVPAK